MADIGTQAIAELVLRIKAENLAGAVLSSVAGNVRALPLVAAGAAAGMAVATAKMAADYQRMITQVANNTTMGTSGLHTMDAAIKGIAAHSPASLDSLAQGYMHIANFGFGAADATKILDAAQRSAVSTGGDVAQTANILANVLHEYSLGGGEAAHAMDVLHLAAAQGNMTLQELVESGGRAIGMAANLHIPLTQVTAALSALTRHGESADVAGTYVTGMLSKIVNPAKAAREELTALSAQTGIDLLADFTPAGLQTKGLAGVLADLRAAHVDAAELFKIVPAQRGGLAAQILTGTGSADYTTILASLADTMAGKTRPTADAYARSQQTLAFQTGVLKNNLQELGITIGTALLPGLTKLVAAIVPIIGHVTAWASAHGKLIATATPIFIVLSTIAGLALTAGAAVGLLAVVFSPLSLAVMAIVAAMGLLSVAWATNWGGIQQKVSAAWTAIQPAIRQIEQAISAIGGAFKKGGLSGAANELMTQAGTLLGRLLSWTTGTAWPVLSAAVGRWALAFWQWVERVAPPIMAALGVLLGRLAGWIGRVALPAIAAQVGRWAGAFWQWVQRATPPLLSALGALLGRLGAWLIGTALPAIAAQVGRWVTAFWQWVGPATAALISHLGPLLDRLGGWIGTTALPAIGAKLAQWGTAFWHWIVVALPLMQEKLGEFLGQMIVWIPTASVALSLKLLQWGAAFIGWLMPRWIEMQGKLAEFLGNIGKWIVTTALPALLKLGWDMGTQLIAGLVKGISDAAAKVHEAIQNALHGRHTTLPSGPLNRPGTAGGWGMGGAWGPAPAAVARQPGHPFGPAIPPGFHAPSAVAHHIVHHIVHHSAQRHDHRHTTTAPPPPAGTGTSSGGLSPATQAAIAAASGNAPKKETPAQTAAADFRAALTYFRAEKGLDPALVARMQADIALIARSDPSRAKDLSATLTTVRARREDAIRHAGAVAAHHRQVEDEKKRRATVTDDVYQFKTDLLTLGTSLKDHARLVADYLRIQKDEITAHIRSKQVAYDLAENMHRVNEHFKIAAGARTPVAPVPRYGTLASETGYGQTTVSFGGAQVNPWQAMVAALREQITHLRAQLAKDDQVIALLELGNAGQGQQLGVLRTIAGGISRIPVPPAPAGGRSAHSVLKAAGSYAPVTR